jgi:aspartate 1-decarboxylase
MQIQVLKSKIRVKVTGRFKLYWQYYWWKPVRSLKYYWRWKVSIVNINNGERFETYAIKGARNSGEITLNGPASSKDDIIIIISYALEFEEAKRSSLGLFSQMKRQFFNLITISSKINVILT